MTAAERCQQEQRLAKLFIRQREANERNEHERADALFTQISAALTEGPEERRNFRLTPTADTQLRPHVHARSMNDTLDSSSTRKRKGPGKDSTRTHLINTQSLLPGACLQKRSASKRRENATCSARQVDLISSLPIYEIASS
jgi:hypothetical protein